MILAVDFDGTMVEHDYPDVGAELPGAVEALKAILARGDRIILWTMRSGDRLRDAVKWCEDRGVVLEGANINPQQGAWTSSPKAYAHVYIDDAALGCPLIHPEGKRPYVDWAKVRFLLGV